MSQSPDKVESVSLKDLVGLLAKYPFAYLFVAFGIFFAVDGSVRIGVAGRSLAIGPLVSEDVRSILILAAGIGVALGMHELFLGKRRGKERFRRVAHILLLIGVVIFSFARPVISFFSSGQVVGYHEVSSKGIYGVNLTSNATKKHAGKYLILAARRHQEILPVMSDPSVAFSEPTKIRSSETDDRFAVQFESEEEYTQNQAEGLNRFECVLLTVDEELIDKAKNVSTVDALEEIGAVRLRELHQDIFYEPPTFAEIFRDEFLASLTSEQRSQLFDKLKLDDESN